METQKSNMQYHLRSIIIDVMWYDMIFQIGHQHIVENVFWIWIKNISKVIFCFKTSTLLPGIYSHISWQFYHEIIQYNWRINWKKSPLGNSPCVLFQQQLEISNRKCCAVHFQKFKSCSSILKIIIKIPDKIKMVRYQGAFFINQL